MKPNIIATGGTIGGDPESTDHPIHKEGGTIIGADYISGNNGNPDSSNLTTDSARNLHKALEAVMGIPTTPTALIYHGWDQIEGETK